MRKPGSNAEGRNDGGALALIAICGLVVAAGLLLAAFDRLATLVPMARTVAVQAMH
jgi:hypothetical protein